MAFKKPYPNAPVSSLFLFHKKQELAFQMEENNNPKSRHHVRFWSTPKHWWLPGGRKANLLGSATFDKKVGFSSFTLQFTHKIEENTDIERDFVVDTIKQSTLGAKITIAEHFNSGYFDRNGGGDNIRTDGALPFINLRNKKE
ncbi:MAG: LssY C-terminal domain-containing protein [Candidatus Saccharibacteria bacterium]|nr:LssY C-terminal domain-containing protein [Candidatus Saccharibacteria bacterium]